MYRGRFIAIVNLVAAILILTALLLAGCAARRGPAPTPRAEATATLTALPRMAPEILLLPTAFRYEMTLRRAGGEGEPPTVITGQYREGALAQSSRRGEDPAEELVIATDPASGALRSYTHSADEPTWTRWPGVGFDASFGLISPLTVLRLYPLADEAARGELDPVSGAPEATVKVQALFSAATVARLLTAGASAVTVNPEERAALEAQFAPVLVSQTFTYWVSENKRVYRSAATLLTGGPDEEPTPWLEILWRFWDYDNPAIVVTAPTTFADAPGLAAEAQPTAAGSAQPTTPEPVLDPATNLRVRVFAGPGIPAEDATVAVYPAGSQQAVDEHKGADAQFALATGTYDVLVRADKTEEWLKGIEVVTDTLASQDVLFDFGTLELTVMQNGVLPKVDIVIYPAGQRQTWVDWRTENPTTVRLVAGSYDIEVALPDFTGTKRFDGIVVRGGQETTQTLEIGK